MPESTKIVIKENKFLCCQIILLKYSGQKHPDLCLLLKLIFVFIVDKAPGVFCLRVRNSQFRK